MSEGILLSFLAISFFLPACCVQQEMNLATNITVVIKQAVTPIGDSCCVLKKRELAKRKSRPRSYRILLASTLGSYFLHDEPPVDGWVLLVAMHFPSTPALNSNPVVGCLNTRSASPVHRLQNAHFGPFLGWYKPLGMIFPHFTSFR
jgi:hypothetical protein